MREQTGEEVRQQMMDKRRKQVSHFAFPLATAITFPVIIVAARLLLGDSLPLQALAVMLGTYVMGLVWVAMSMTARRQEYQFHPATGATQAQAAVSPSAPLPGLELVYTLPAPAVPCTVAVIDSAGVCPRGLRLHDSLDVDPEGRLTYKPGGIGLVVSAPICRTAAGALEPLLAQVVGGRDHEVRVSCHCPLPGRQLTFGVREASPTRLN